MVKKEKTFFEQVQAIIHLGNVTRVLLLDKDGKKSIDISLTLLILLGLFVAPLVILVLVVYLIDGHSIELVRPSIIKK